MGPKTVARKKAMVVDEALRGMFKRLEGRPAPAHISAIVDQLEAVDEVQQMKKSGTGG